MYSKGSFKRKKVTWFVIISYLYRLPKNVTIAIKGWLANRKGHKKEQLMVTLAMLDFEGIQWSVQYCIDKN